jgi:hypothetical protein
MTIPKPRRVENGRQGRSLVARCLAGHRPQANELVRRGALPRQIPFAPSLRAPLVCPYLRTPLRGAVPVSPTIFPIVRPLYLSSKLHHD